VTVTVAYLVVRTGEAALGIGLGASPVRMAVFDAHERAWATALPAGGAGSVERGKR